VTRNFLLKQEGWIGGGKGILPLGCIPVGGEGGSPSLSLQNVKNIGSKMISAGQKN